MTAPSTLAVEAGAKGEIIGLWPTPVWLGHLDLSELRPSEWPDLSSPEAGDRLPFAGAVEEAALTGCQLVPDPRVERDAALQLGNDGSSGRAAVRWAWRRTVETWDAGFFVGARYVPEDIRVLVVLRSETPHEYPDSGALFIHDPRDGAGHVTIPGLPWGRPLRIPAQPGLALAFPGWLRWSVAPLRPGHSMTVWIGSASRDRNAS